MDDAPAVVGEVEAGVVINKIDDVLVIVTDDATV